MRQSLVPAPPHVQSPKKGLYIADAVAAANARISFLHPSATRAGMAEDTKTEETNAEAIPVIETKDGKEAFFKNERPMLTKDQAVEGAKNSVQYTKDLAKIGLWDPIVVEGSTALLGAVGIMKPKKAPKLVPEHIPGLLGDSPAGKPGKLPHACPID